MTFKQCPTPPLGNYGRFLSAGLISVFLLAISCDNDDPAPSATCSNCPPTVYLWSPAATTDGNIGGVNGADTICEANVPSGLSGFNHRAVIGTSANVPKNYFSTNPQVRRSDRTTVIANSWQIFFDVSITVPNSVGTALGSYWTGLDWGGNVDTGNNCNDWTSASNAVLGRQGRENSVSRIRYHGTGFNNCDNPRRVLCVSY